MNSGVKPVVGHEVILFRTRSEILTDRRILIRGSIYSLSEITETQVQPTWYYVPFLLARLLLLAVAALLVLSFFHVVGHDVVPGNPNLNLFCGAVLGLVLVFMTWAVPTHDLKMKTASGQTEIFMRRHDAGHLREVKVKIEAAIRAQRAMTG